MSLQPSFTALIIAAFILTVSSGIYLFRQNRKRLEEFRRNLRPGDLVRVKNSTGTIRARIMKRNTSFSFIALDIDSKQPILTITSNIYRP